MIKRIISFAFILYGISSAYSQDCFDKVAKQAVLIDSLQKVIKDANNQFYNLATITQTTQKALSDTIKLLKSDLSSLEKFKAQKKSNDAQLKLKSDSIALLKTQLSEKDKQIATDKQQGDQKARAENERGKKEALANLVITYKKPFDDLIESSSKETVQRDILVVGNNTEIKLVLKDLETYFFALEMLAKKFDMAQIKNIQTQLNQIKQNSVLLEKLKKTISKYQTFNDGMKETLNALVTLDKRESATGMGDEIQKLKFNKIMSELSTYIFNYDFNFTDYPYLSEIVLKIIKRKQPNADEDITDLLKEL
jgi:hypothetical protein